MVILILIQVMAFALLNVSLISFLDIAEGVARKRVAIETAAAIGIAAIAFYFTAPQLQMLTAH